MKTRSSSAGSAFSAENGAKSAFFAPYLFYKRSSGASGGLYKVEKDTQNQKVLQTLRVGASFSRAYSGTEIWSTFDPHRFTDFG